MKKIILALLSICAIPFISSAQDFHPYANSNYAGVSGVDLNPACIADSRFKVDVLLGGFSFNFSDNYVGMKKTAFAHPNGSFIGAIKDTTGNGFPAFKDSLFKDNYLTTRNNADVKSVFMSNRIQFPSFMVTINDKSAIAFTAEMRSMVNVDGFEEPLAELAYYGFDRPSLWTQKFTNNHLSIQYMSWMEFGVDYARVLVDDNKNFLKIGVRPKLLLGLGSAYMFADNMEYLANNKDTLTFFDSHIQYGHSTNFDFPAGQGVSYNLKGTVSHPGIGLDIGLVYEWRPHYQDYQYDMDGETNIWRKSKNKYKLRAGLSVTDIGSIKFDRGQLSNDFVANINEWNVHNLNFSGSFPIRSLDDTLRSRFPPIPTSKTYKMNLPLCISAQIDYQIWKDFYLNFTGTFAEQWKKNPNKVHELSAMSITPRWDYKWFGVMVPFSYNQYKNFTTGACVRLGPLILGTSSLAPYLSKKKTIYGADFYLQMKIPIFYKEPKDKDKDKVSNKKDHCIDIPGVWEFLGCPDRDGDHVQDSEDLCPDDPGLKSLNGCPDRDGDGITDKQDACPDDPGLAKFNGCPDKDGDGIIDKDDDCPDEPGLAAFKGCPDRDGDGVMDKIDLCPDKPGPVENEGCPEIILNLVDLAGQSLKSAKQAKDESFTYESLPKDSICVFRLDGDPDKTIGVNEVKVIVNGSPKRAIRSQADGLFRFDIPKAIGNGLKAVDVNDAIIVLTKEEQAVVKKAFDNLEFESGKAVIRTTSYAALDQLATLLIKHPEWALKISGHTDNVGNAAQNMTLSKNRSESVKKYLVSKGVNASHLKTEYFGQTRPIVPNNSDVNRQKNRRVEMLIIDFATMGPAEQATPTKTPAKKPVKPPVKKPK